MAARGARGDWYDDDEADYHARYANVEAHRRRPDARGGGGATTAAGASYGRAERRERGERAPRRGERDAGGAPRRSNSRRGNDSGAAASAQQPDAEDSAAAGAGPDGVLPEFAWCMRTWVLPYPWGRCAARALSTHSCMATWREIRSVLTQRG
jgi:hypothetical protein